MFAYNEIIISYVNVQELRIIPTHELFSQETVMLKQKGNGICLTCMKH